MKRKWFSRNEMNHRYPVHNQVCIRRRWRCLPCGTGRDPSAKLKTTIYEKRLELTNRKGVVLDPDNTKPHISLQTRQKLIQIGWVFYYSVCTQLILLRITTYFDHYKILLIWIIFSSVEACKRRIKSWSCFKDGEQ